jgi:hypothetical protein
MLSKKYEVLCVSDKDGTERYFMLKPNQQPPDGWTVHASERVIKEQQYNRCLPYGISRERVTK